MSPMSWQVEDTNEPETPQVLLTSDWAVASDPNGGKQLACERKKNRS